MTNRESEQREALWVWVRRLDAATEAALANIDATLASNRADASEDRNAGHGGAWSDRRTAASSEAVC